MTRFAVEAVCRWPSLAGIQFNAKAVPVSGLAPEFGRDSDQTGM